MPARREHNLDIVRRVYEAFGRGNLEGILARYALRCFRRVRITAPVFAITTIIGTTHHPHAVFCIRYNAGIVTPIPIANARHDRCPSSHDSVVVTGAITNSAIPNHWFGLRMLSGVVRA